MIASPIASTTPGLSGHDEILSSEKSLSKSSSSQKGGSSRKISKRAIVPVPMVSSRTRSRTSTQKQTEVLRPHGVPKVKEVGSSSRVKIFKNHPPSASSSESDSEEETENLEQESEAESDPST